MIAVVPGDAALVELEADATVRGYPGREVRDADRDVVDARENGRLLRLDFRALHDIAHALQPVPRPLRDRFGL